MLVLQPTTIEVMLLDAEHRDTLGRVQFAFSPPPPLSDDERRAIAGRPGATRLIEMALSCPQCKAEARYYSLLETSASPPARLVQSATDIRMAPDVWSCECGGRQIPLSYAKQGIHQLFREMAPQSDSALDLSPVYEAGEIRGIADEYADLLRSKPEEEAVQKFLETHPIAWAFLSPARILHKPPILAQQKADFGILTTTRELVLVEIEKPSTQLLTKSHGISAAIQRGAEQIRDWDSVIVTHRAAVLSQLSLSEQDVHHIRYLLIGGMCSAADPKGLRKLRRVELAPSTLFMGFDELGFFLETLACTVAGI